MHVSLVCPVCALNPCMLARPAGHGSDSVHGCCEFLPTRHVYVESFDVYFWPVVPVFDAVANTMQHV